MSTSPRYWAVIPAAGIGTRMGTNTPKQYLKLRGKYILEYVLDCFCQHSRIEGVIVAIANSDKIWPQLAVATNDKITCTPGGVERCHSVFNGLEYLNNHAQPDDWVMVHDAARPCIRHDDIDELISELADHSVGGLLALPVKDTMKRSNSYGDVAETVDRENLWHALTPQMFRLGELHEAMKCIINKGHIVTDEAQAMEFSGMQPKLIQGHPSNIKITEYSDLPLAELFLSQQQEGN